MKTISSFYEVLGVGPSAGSETIRKAYRRLASKHHPDVSSDPDAHENMARINEAFNTLVDPEKRAEYDAMLAGGSFQAPSAPRREPPQKPIRVKFLTRLTAHQTPVYAISFTPDTGDLISSAFDNEIIWWDDELARPARRTKLEAGVVSTLRAFPEGRLVAAGSAENLVSLWNLNGAIVDSWRHNSEEWVSCVAISSDGNSLATGSLYKTFAVSSTTDGGSLYRKQEHDQSVTALAWSSDGKYLATGSADASVKLFHGKSGALLHTFRQIRSTVTAIAFSADDRYLAVAAVDLSIRVFRLSDGGLEKMMFGHTKPIETLAFHPNGWLFASGSRDGTVGLWNAAKGIGNVRIEASHRPISCVAFSPDGSKLAAGGQDKLVRVWEVTAKNSV
ncbi:MAG TPA: DnaJ domain-containing protein [Fimbriimonadaceae bacterium]|nr:DnaJ domain-containing protein [Fimbriimonadaceae bacterium]